MYVASTATTTINTVHCEMRFECDDAQIELRNTWTSTVDYFPGELKFVGGTGGFVTTTAVPVAE